MNRNAPGPFFARRMSPIDELDTRGIAGVTHADGGGWRVVRITEDPMPATVWRPAGSLASGLTHVIDGATGFVKAELATGDVFHAGEYVDPGFWHRLVGEVAPISPTLGHPRPCPVHGHRTPETIARESRSGTAWSIQVWTCQPGASASQRTTESRADDGRPLRCAGRCVDAPTGRVLRGPYDTYGATQVTDLDADPAGYYRGESPVA